MQLENLCLNKIMLKETNKKLEKSIASKQADDTHFDCISEDAIIFWKI